ncbi:MAG: GIY-YIG nuclease family protein [Balneolaceae bacterium]|nr:GIY-YIG nuclease family protein [Balneolaceae bacterium]
MYWGYIIYSNSKDRFYTGASGVGVEIRVDRHNSGWTRSTKSGIPWELKYVRTFESKTDALKWERMVKSKKSRVFIEKLINSSENEVI